MGMYVILAWRNIRRNVHRTLITVSSVFFAVLLVLFMRSMQRGSYEHIIRNTLSLSTGFIQVHGAGFWEKRNLENSMEVNDSILQKIKDIKHVTSAVSRIESFALASSGQNSRGVAITGINPESEKNMNNLSDRVVKGVYLQSGAIATLIADKLAQYLKVSINDSLVLLSQGFHGAGAAGLYPVKGLVSLPVPDLNAGMLYMTLDEAQYFFTMPGMVTTLAIMIDKPGNLQIVESQIRTMFSDRYEVMNWRQMLPELVQSIEIDNAGGVIMLGILYLVIGFGIFGTVMMMVAERMREFAILISVGMKKWRMGIIVFLETLMVAMIGALLGAIVSLPLLLYMRANPIHLHGDIAEAMIRFGYEPIVPFLLDISLFTNQILVVFVIALFSCIYPWYAILKINLSKELRA
jgi:ABC-type lipoprotein release transport system permease subunit